MEKRHITYFKVENFKKFESLEVKNIGQFNLIVGDNNVGKTCLLEALLFDSRPKNTINWYYELLVKRRMVAEKLELLKETDYEINYEKNAFSFYQKDKSKKVSFMIDGKEYSFNNIQEEMNVSDNPKYKEFIQKEDLFAYDGIRKKSKNWIVFEEDDKVRFLLDLTSTYYKDFINKPENSKIPRVPAIMLNDEIEKYITSYYDRIFIEKNLGSTVSELMREVFPNINIKTFHKEGKKNYSLYIETEGRDIPHNIREYGEGFIRVLFSILLILNDESKKIVIDEIDTGIHYSKMESFWRAFIKLVEKYNIQVFATTHSKGCIDAFVKVLNDAEKSNLGRIVSLQQEEDKEKAYTYFTENLDTNFDYRG